MNIVIIGTGNAATVLGKKMKHAGHKILQVFGRDAMAASQLAYLLDTQSANYWTVLRKDADVYLIMVADDAIADVAAHLKLPGKVVAHTAGSMNREVLQKISPHYGVFYPLQSLRKDVTHLPDTPVFIDASDETAKKVLEELAHSIAPQQVFLATDEQRLKLHVAAVFASNFTNHLYKLSEDYCKSEGISFSELLPLIIETAQRLKTTSPVNAQTGPAIRNDEPTIQLHLKMLEKYPHLKNIYELLTKSIQQPS